jgi:hypothetical protein
MSVRNTDTIHTSKTYARTFENSEDGDMTKLSLVLDQEMRCWMVWSSNILQYGQPLRREK